MAEIKSVMLSEDEYFVLKTFIELEIAEAILDEIRLPLKDVTKDHAKKILDKLKEKGMIELTMEDLPFS